jgi:hypothetical protein
VNFQWPNRLHPEWAFGGNEEEIPTALEEQAVRRISMDRNPDWQPLETTPLEGGSVREEVRLNRPCELRVKNSEERSPFSFLAIAKFWELTPTVVTKTRFQKPVAQVRA